MHRPLALLALAAFLACSTDQSVGPPAPAGSFAPRLSRFGDRIVLSWIEPDASGVPALRFSRRSGSTWMEVRTVVRDASLAADAADVPSVVPLGDGRLAAHWTAKRGGSAVARDLLVSVSGDDGASWSAPVRPHRDGTDSEHAMAALVPAKSGGGFGIVWLDGRAGALAEYGEGGTSLYWADWTGDGFGPEAVLDPRVCDCCKTSGAAGPAGPIVAYRDRSDGERRDIALVRRDGGGWSAPRPVHRDGWTLAACPTNGPAVAAEGERAVVAWFTGADASPSVWAALSADGGSTLGAPVRLDGGSPVGRVDAAVLRDGSAAIVWLERGGPDAEVRVRRIAPVGKVMPTVVVAKTTASRASGYPTITATSDGGVLVAWTEVGSVRRVRAALVTLP